ncbi:MAG: cupin domain-containing protein [Candidatus Sumerlaeota bacterium]
MECKLRTKAQSQESAIVNDWGSLTWLSSKELTDNNLTLGRVIIKPGESNPRHAHDSCEEVLYLLQGELTHTFGEESVEMKAGDTLVVPGGVMHNATNTGDVDADMMVAYSSGERDFRKED